MEIVEVQALPLQKVMLQHNSPSTHTCLKCLKCLIAAVLTLQPGRRSSDKELNYLRSRPDNTRLTLTGQMKIGLLFSSVSPAICATRL